MDRAQKERLAQRDILYRLAVVLGVGWNQFQQMEFWEIRNRAFVMGESVTDAKITRLDQLVIAQRLGKQEHPEQAQIQINQWYLKAVQVEDEYSDGSEQMMHRQNKAFFDELKSTYAIQHSK